MLRTIARFRTVLLLLGILLCLTEQLHGVGALFWVGVVLIVGGIVLFFVSSGGADRRPVVVRSPVRGRWCRSTALPTRSPATGRTSWGRRMRSTSSTFPMGRRLWNPLRRWPLAARPATFPAFGQDVLAPADGVVVQASGWQRDHWSRNSLPGFLYLLVEGMVFRQFLSLLTLSGGRFVVGNSVTLDLGDGVYAVFAHLRRGSVRVAKGDRVRAGDVLGEVGNSGNTSEPHLHFHLMDRPRPLAAPASRSPSATRLAAAPRPASPAPALRSPARAPRHRRPLTPGGEAT